MSKFDSDTDIKMVDGTPSPGVSSTITTSAFVDTDRAPAPRTSTTANTTTTTTTTSTSAPFSISVPSAAFPKDSSNREALNSPPRSPAGHNQQPEQHSARSVVDIDQEYITHEYIASLFHCQQMTDIEWKNNIKSVLKYISDHLTDSTFVSIVRSLVDTSLTVLRTYAATLMSSHSSDTVPSFLHAFCIEAAPHLFPILKHNALLRDISPQSVLFQHVLLQIEEFIQLLFCISQRSQIDRAIIKNSNAIYNILKHFPADAPAMIFSSLSSFSISNSDHVFDAIYILSDLGDFSKSISSSQCATASQWIDAALSMELDHDDDHTIEIMKSLYWTSYRQYTTNISDSNRVVHLQPFRDFIAKHLNRSADIPIVLAYYIKLAKLNFEYASTLLEQVFVELERNITCWNRYSAVIDKIEVISNLIKLIMTSTHSDKHILVNRLKSILESDAVPFVVPTGEVQGNNNAYNIWMSIHIPGVNNYELILLKATQLLANPQRDYTEVVSEFVSKEEHISDVYYLIYYIAKGHHHYEVPVPVQLIPHAINAIVNPDIASDTKKVAHDFLHSKFYDLSLEPIDGASMDLDIEAVTNSRGIESFLKYNLSSALSDNIIAAINHILETRRDINLEARMNARNLLESLDQLGEALARVYHRQHPLTETPHLPPVNSRRVEERIRECTHQFLEQHGAGADNDVDLVADDGGDGQMDVMANTVRNMDVDAKMGSIMPAQNVNEVAIDLADEDEDNGNEIQEEIMATRNTISVMHPFNNPPATDCPSAHSSQPTTSDITGGQHASDLAGNHSTPGFIMEIEVSSESNPPLDENHTVHAQTIVEMDSHSSDATQTVPSTRCTPVPRAYSNLFSKLLGMVTTSFSWKMNDVGIPSNMLVTDSEILILESDLTLAGLRRELIQKDYLDISNISLDNTENTARSDTHVDTDDSLVKSKVVASVNYIITAYINSVAKKHRTLIDTNLLQCYIRTSAFSTLLSDYISSTPTNITQKWLLLVVSSLGYRLLDQIESIMKLVLSTTLCHVYVSALCLTNAVDTISPMSRRRLMQIVVKSEYIGSFFTIMHYLRDKRNYYVLPVQRNKVYRLPIHISSEDTSNDQDPQIDLVSVSEFESCNGLNPLYPPPGLLSRWTYQYNGIDNIIFHPSSGDAIKPIKHKDNHSDKDYSNMIRFVSEHGVFMYCRNWYLILFYVLLLIGVAVSIAVVFVFRRSGIDPGILTLAILVVAAILVVCMRVLLRHATIHDIIRCRTAVTKLSHYLSKANACEGCVLATMIVRRAEFTQFAVGSHVSLVGGEQSRSSARESGKVMIDTACSADCLTRAGFTVTSSIRYIRHSDAADQVAGILRITDPDIPAMLNHLVADAGANRFKVINSNDYFLLAKNHGERQLMDTHALGVATIVDRKVERIVWFDSIIYGVVDINCFRIPSDSGNSGNSTAANSEKQTEPSSSNSN